MQSEKNKSLKNGVVYRVHHPAIADISLIVNPVATALFDDPAPRDAA